MRKIPKSISLIGAAALLAAAFVVPPASAVEETTKYTDEEIVLGLVFGVGDFSEAIGTQVELSATADRDLEESTALYEASVAEVTESLLAESEELQAAIDTLRAGDPLAAEAAFVVIGDVLNDYAEQQVAAQPDSQYPSVEPAVSPCGVAVVCWAYAAAAVHNTAVVTAAAAVVVAAALWCGAWAWCSGSAAADEQSQLAREQLAADVATAVTS